MTSKSGTCDLADFGIMASKATVRRRLEALRAAGYPTSVAELDERSRLPETVPNAADLYLRAFAAYVDPPEDMEVPSLGYCGILGRIPPLAEEDAETILEHLTRNQQCLSLLHQAGENVECRFDRNPEELVPNGPSVTRCAYLLRVNAFFRAHQGDTHTAMFSIHDGMRLADSLRGPTLAITYMVRTAVCRQTITGLEWTLNMARYNDQQLMDLDAILAAAERSYDLAEVIVGERCQMIDACRTPKHLYWSWWHRLLVRLPWMQRIGLVDCLDYSDRLIEVCRLSGGERMQRFREMEVHLEGLSALHTVAKDYCLGIISVVRIDALTHACLALARGSLAVERSRLATGNVPECLEQLVPRYIEQVPIDPFDGRPIRYRRTDPGYILYSVRTDGQDNGGMERGQVAEDEPFDLCFVVAR